MISHKHQVILNIGLAREGKDDLTFTEVYKAINTCNISHLRFERVQSDTEETLVVNALIYSDFDVARLSARLEQDCIAIWDLAHQEGRLAGPNAAKWGDFNPEFFLLLNGSRLSDARSVA